MQHTHIILMVVVLLFLMISGYMLKIQPNYLAVSNHHEDYEEQYITIFDPQMQITCVVDHFNKLE
jgi:hypothetical protein